MSKRSLCHAQPSTIARVFNSALRFLFRLRFIFLLLVVLIFSDRAAARLDQTSAEEKTYLPMVMRSLALLENGDFEKGTVGWTEYSKNGLKIIDSERPDENTPPHSGDYFAWLGGDHDEVSYIQRSTYIDQSSPVLTYYHWIQSEDACDYDYAYFIVNGIEVRKHTLCVETETDGWVKQSVNLKANAGQIVTFQIRVETDKLLLSNLLIDDVALEPVP